MNELFALILATFSVGPPIEPVFPDSNTLQLVRQLGNNSFAVREAAARDLIKSGGIAVPALIIGSKNSDPEVAERCKKMISAAIAVQRDKILKEFLQEPPGLPPASLAGVERFLKITGDSHRNRELYAKMLIDHHQILETMETDPRGGSRRLTEYVRESFEQWKMRTDAKRIRDKEPFTDLSQATLLMFARTHPKYIDDELISVRINRMFDSRKLTESLSGSNEIPGMRKLFLNWLATEQRYVILLRMYQIAEKAELKEAVTTLMLISTDPKHSIESRLDALVAVGRIGGKQQVMAISPLLDDKTEIGTYNLGEDGPLLTVQVRDVALIVSAHLAGEKIDNYGYASSRFGDGAPVAFQACGFSNNDARESAHARWKERLKKSNDTSKH